MSNELKVTELDQAMAEVKRLRTELELERRARINDVLIEAFTGDGTSTAELEQDAARYRYIRTHRIGVKWCELYAGGPALDGVIDSMMKDAGPSPINSAALRAAEQAHAKGRTESVIAIYRAIREAQIDLPPPSSAPSSGLDFP